MFAEGAKQMRPEPYPTLLLNGDSLRLYQDRELTLRDLLQMFRRRRSIVFGAAGLFFALGILLCLFTTRRYQATGTIQVQKESSDGLDLNSLMGSAANTTDAPDADINIQTQASILQSNELALRAIHNLRPGVRRRESADPGSEPATGPLEKSPRRQAKTP